MKFFWGKFCWRVVMSPIYFHGGWNYDRPLFPCYEKTNYITRIIGTLVVFVREMLPQDYPSVPHPTNMGHAGWLERQKGMLFNHMVLLMQSEVERFHAGTSMLYDYDNAKRQEATHDDSFVMVSDTDFFHTLCCSARCLPPALSTRF